MPAKNLLFLCTGNSARSILAEALLERLGPPRYRGFSAGSQPKSVPHPLAIATLLDKGYDTSRLRSKSWEEFAREDAPKLDLIITVCDNAAAESCPVWPGNPAVAHWSHADPAAVVGSEPERRAAFEKTYEALRTKIESLSKIDPEESDFLERVKAIAQN